MFNGRVLKELRLLNGLSRAELAQRINLTEQAIWQFESNERNLNYQPKCIWPTNFMLI
ncbi:transcriptional regulator [Streptococcus pneumoniae]|nr:transcriptional regulator [Streptococcus pneumoniae]